MTGHSYKNVKKTCRILCSDFPSCWKIWSFFCTCYRQKMSLPVPFYEFAYFREFGDKSDFPPISSGSTEALCWNNSNPIPLCLL